MTSSAPHMQIQRSLLFRIVVVCLFTCAATMCIIVVVVNQSSIQTTNSALQAYEIRIRLLESQTMDLRRVLEKTQARLSKLEEKIFPTSPKKSNNVNDSPSLEPRGSALLGLDEQDYAKGDDGGMDENDMQSHLDKANQDETASKARWLRSTRRQRNGERCPRRCKGEKGRRGAKGEQGTTGAQGETGPVSYGGDKGQKGDQGPPGDCDCHTRTDATVTPVTTQGPGVSLWSDVRPAALLAAHFEGGRHATINIGDRRDPINMGYIDLGEIDGGWVPYWRYAQWMDMETRSKFVLQRRGNVTVTDGGIYYVYSQMLYYDPSVFMGHSVYIGNQKLFSCTECTVDRDRKFNTCYIGGVVQINSGDTIGIRVSYANRMINLNPDSTHFGLIRLS